jgi:hypothetical protein
LELEDLDSGISPKKKDATISKLFGSSKLKGKKAETASASGTGKLVVKKKSVLEPVSLGAVSAPASDAAAASIVGKSKSGTKASLLKLGKLSLGSASASKVDE